MDEKIKELTLLLLYLTSWKEHDYPAEMSRSWKGYPFDILDELTDENLIFGSKRAKSVHLTESGIKEAKELKKKYQIYEVAKLTEADDTFENRISDEEKGKEIGIRKVAMELLKKGTSIDFIADVTHLNIGEIEEAKRQLKDV